MYYYKQRAEPQNSHPDQIDPDASTVTVSMPTQKIKLVALHVPCERLSVKSKDLPKDQKFRSSGFM